MFSVRYYSSKPGLKEFLHQQKVREFYRTVLRTVYSECDVQDGSRKSGILTLEELPKGQREELRDFARQEFRNSMKTKELEDQKYLLSLGKRQFQSIRASIPSI